MSTSPFLSVKKTDPDGGKREIVFGDSFGRAVRLALLLVALLIASLKHLQIDWASLIKELLRLVRGL